MSNALPDANTHTHTHTIYIYIYIVCVCVCKENCTHRTDKTPLTKLREASMKGTVFLK
jgi:hypothetical protein